MATSQEKHEIMHNFYDNLIEKAADRSISLDLNAFHRNGVDLSMLDGPISE